MKSNENRKLISLFCTLIMILSLCGCAAKQNKYEPYTLLPREFLLGETLDENGNIILPDETIQLTADDIQSMNHGNARMCFNEEGYLTFLNGRYYDGRIEDQEDAVASLQGIAGLLGLGAGSDFFCEYGEKNNNTGYTYYTFKQRYGEGTMENRTLKVFIDPEGYAAGLSSSFVPNLGYAEPVDWVAPQQAETVITDTVYPGKNITVYSEYTQKVAVTYNETIYSAYAVYTDNFTQAGQDAGLPYLVSYVNWDGTYIDTYATSVLSGIETDQTASAYFEGMKPSTYTGTVWLQDGSSTSITVPIAYDAEKECYYLMDVDRKIAVADRTMFFDQGFVSFSSSSDGQTWDNNHLLAFYNYIRVYDFFANMGIYSIDGTGAPILVCCDWLDDYGEPFDNASSSGILRGWAVFSMSDANHFSEAVDVIAHEFTHGVSGYMRGGDIYMNHTGAINEGFSDIMGNVVEMSLGATTDTQWLIGEMSGRVLRSLSDPLLSSNPIELGGQYYAPPVPPSEVDNEKNDRGGVHINASLLSQMSYKLYQYGMSLEEESRLWFTCMGLITPKSDYNEIYEALMMSVKMLELDQRYADFLTDAFQKAKLIS